MDWAVYDARPPGARYCATGRAGPSKLKRSGASGIVKAISEHTIRISGASSSGREEIEISGQWLGKRRYGWSNIT